MRTSGQLSLGNPCLQMDWIYSHISSYERSDITVEKEKQINSEAAFRMAELRYLDILSKAPLALFFLAQRLPGCIQ